MVVRGVPKTSPSDVMQIIKSISAREFFRRYPETKKRYFLGGKLWTQSYFVEKAAFAMTDNQSADRLQQARQSLFKTIDEREISAG